VKAAYLLDQTCNIENAPEVYREAAHAVISSGGLVEWVIPKGTVVDGDEALLRVRTGQAKPIDEECAAACGMTAGELSRCQREYMSAMAGIRGKKDQELFMAGVIEGYEPGTTDEKTIYKRGPLWDKYQAALKAKAEAE
jgi:hypothetical protein